MFSRVSNKTYLLDLLGEFAGWCQYKSLALSQWEVNLLQQSNRECGRLASSRLSLGNHIKSWKSKYFIKKSVPFEVKKANKQHASLFMLSNILRSQSLFDNDLTQLLHSGVYSPSNSSPPEKFDTNYSCTIFNGVLLRKIQVTFFIRQLSQYIDGPPM